MATLPKAGKNITGESVYYGWNVYYACPRIETHPSLQYALLFETDNG